MSPGAGRQRSASVTMALAISPASWPPIPSAMMKLNGSLPYLSVSTDRGASWRAPIMVAAPGVQSVRRIAVAVRKRGQVAIAYPGTTDGEHFNGYITESRNVLIGRPRFWSAPVGATSSNLDARRKLRFRSVVCACVPSPITSRV